MNKREIAILACRLLSILVLVIAVAWLPFLGSVLSGATVDGGQELLLTWCALVLFLALSLALWLGADRIAGWMVRSRRAEGAPVEGPGADLHAMAFSVLGAFLLVSATTFLIRFLVVENLREEGAWDVGPHEIGTLVGNAVKLALGLLLFLRSDAVVSFWRSWRPAQPSSTDATDSHSR